MDNSYSYYVTTCLECSGQGGFYENYGNGNYEQFRCDYCYGTGETPLPQYLAIGTI